jgi:hypothetical protein
MMNPRPKADAPMMLLSAFFSSCREKKMPKQA